MAPPNLRRGRSLRRQPTGVSKDGPWCARPVDPNPTATRDLLDEEVKAEAHGTFGPATTWGVQPFPETAGQAATGKVDAATREALDVALAAQTRARAVPPPVNPEDSGREVERIQAAMVELGHYRPQAAERQQGRYTGKLVRAVRKFQQQHDNLDAASGAVGPETWRALIDELGPRVAGNAAVKGVILTGRPPVELGSTGEFAAEAERLLQGWGADVQVDRNVTREDRAATRSFQEANGLTADGCIGTATAAALTSGRAKAIPTTTSGDTTPAHGSGPEWLLSLFAGSGPGRGPTPHHLGHRNAGIRRHPWPHHPWWRGGLGKSRCGPL